MRCDINRRALAPSLRSEQEMATVSRDCCSVLFHFGKQAEDEETGCRQQLTAHEMGWFGVRCSEMGVPKTKVTLHVPPSRTKISSRRHSNERDEQSDAILWI